MLDQVSVLWVTVKVAAADDDGKAVEDNVAREAEALAVAEAVGVRGAVAVGLDDGNTVAENVSATVLVNVQPCARCPMFDAHG